MRKRLKNRIFQTIGFLGFLAILFSCQGISLSKLVHVDMANSDHQAAECCQSGEGMHITPTHVESFFVFPALKFSVSLLILLVTFAVFSFPLFEYLWDRGKEYIRSIRQRYGSFIPLNSLTSLFSQGLLHSKVF